MNNVSQKLVSVVIPAWNIEKYITQTIESVLCQTYQNIEIIIINDGSTDGTGKILDQYANHDTRIIVFNQTNKGISVARNKGFAMATGEYLCIIDADDIMMPNKIESQVCFLEKHPSADFVYSKVFYFNDETNDIFIRDLKTPDGSDIIYRTLLRHGNFISPNAVLFKRSVFETCGGFDESLLSSEDFDYWLKLAKCGINFIHQDDRLTLCRIRKNSLTADSVTMYSTVIRVFEEHILKGSSKWQTALRYPQYLKNKILYYFSILKRSKRTDESTLSNSKISQKPNLFSLLFALIRKAKWKMTFKKVYNKKVLDYLTVIESHKPL